MVCPALVTVNERCTGPAGAQMSLPPWVAVMAQVPTVRVVAVAPDTVHTSVVLEANKTCSSELAVAVKGTCALTCVSGG